MEDVHPCGSSILDIDENEDSDQELTMTLFREQSLVGAPDILTDDGRGIDLSMDPTTLDTISQAPRMRFMTINQAPRMRFMADSGRHYGSSQHLHLGRGDITATRAGMFGVCDFLRHRENHDDSKPSFDFERTKHLDFDLEKDNLSYVHEQIKIFKGYQFSFDTVQRNNRAFGDGATRQVYNKLSNDLIGTIMVKTHEYFMDVNVDHPFWNSEDNIECFVIFIGMVINSKCLLPYHFAPALLEMISNKKMNMVELEFFMEKIDPIVLNSAKKISPDNFKSLETDYDTHEELYRAKIINYTQFTKRKMDINFMNIYKMISKKFELFDSFYDYDILTIDSTFSGLYTITADRVLSLMYLDQQEHSDIWEKFVRSLSEQELKQMLITFGNTLSLENKYTIYISETLKTDIHITTCYQTVSINKSLFENADHLNNLKLYFTDNDEISDGLNIFRHYDHDDNNNNDNNNNNGINDYASQYPAYDYWESRYISWPPISSEPRIISPRLINPSHFRVSYEPCHSFSPMNGFFDGVSNEMYHCGRSLDIGMLAHFGRHLHFTVHSPQAPIEPIELVLHRTIIIERKKYIKKQNKKLIRKNEFDRKNRNIYSSKKNNLRGRTNYR